MILDRVINRHLRPYERDDPRWGRIKLWHWNRVVYDLGPIFWCLHWVWCYRPFYWLWRLRCRNVSYRLQRHARHVRKEARDAHS